MVASPKTNMTQCQNSINTHEDEGKFFIQSPKGLSKDLSKGFQGGLRHARTFVEQPKEKKNINAVVSQQDTVNELVDEIGSDPMTSDPDRADQTPHIKVDMMNDHNLDLVELNDSKICSSRGRREADDGDG